MADFKSLNGYSVKDETARNNAGALTDLTTDAKTNLVSAINEVDSHADTNASEIGTLSSLTTTDKTDIVSAINEVAGDITTIQGDKIGKIISETWVQLKAMRDGGTLAAGQFYRIIDYATTTVQADTQSAGHAFDVIVRADSSSVLNENAFAIQHEGDTYFASSNLSTWKLKYCLDNDDTRFAWADTTNGKGVIYRMIDEWENDLPYDFKNIQFKRYKANGNVYVASWADSKYTTVQNLWKSFLGSSVTTSNMQYWYSYFAATTVSGNWTDQNGNIVDGSTLGNVNNILHEPPNLVLGMTSDYKWFYTFSKFASVSSEAEDSSLLNSVYKNKSGWGQKSSGVDSLRNNVFIGSNFYSNTVGNDFYSNTVGNYFYSNTVGSNFNSNTVGNNFYSNTVGNNYKWNHIEDGCSNLKFTTDGTLSSFVQKYRVLAGTAPSSAQTVSVTAGNTVPYNVKQTGANTISVAVA